ncbi:MAG: Asp23/Gls24 family envelope stress response protein [Firmicutes bacterium]|nr:Asp23/Gls24 family envelope stress response protein [Bacillota bacterium]
MANDRRKDISDEIIALAAMKAVLMTEGVSGMVDTGDTMSFNKLLGIESGALKGVKIQKQGDGLEVDVALNVRFGASIPQTAWNIQENIKNRVNAISDTPVVKVDVHIAGVTR